MNSVVEFSTSSLRCREITPMKRNRRSHSSVVAGDILCVFGSIVSHEVQLKSIEILNLLEMKLKWQEIELEEFTPRG